MSGTPLLTLSKVSISQEELSYAAYEREREAKARLTTVREVKASEQVEGFLKYVVEGEQDKAEELLKEMPSLALRKGNVTDLSKREFKEITGFQYALWALDWHMWTMLLKYLPIEAAALQFAELEEKGTAHGKHFSLGPLIEALNTYAKQYNGFMGFLRSYWGGEYHWCQVVGGNQLLLPAHVVNEYCHPTRPFSPCPRFEEETLPRSMNLCESQGNWYSSQCNGGKLGEKFAIVRYAWMAAEGQAGEILLGAWEMNGDGCFERATADAEALQSLWKKRREQLEDLRLELHYLTGINEVLNVYFPSALSSTMLGYLR